MLNISIRTGLWMLAGFVAFFLLMYSMGLGDRTELRVFNGMIHLLCLYQAIHAYYARHPEEVENYVAGVAQGMGASLVGVGGFTLFMTLVFLLDPSFLAALSQRMATGEPLNAVTATFFIVTEGIVVSLIGSYIVTRIVGFQIVKRA